MIDSYLVILILYGNICRYELVFVYTRVEDINIRNQKEVLSAFRI